MKKLLYLLFAGRILRGLAMRRPRGYPGGYRAYRGYGNGWDWSLWSRRRNPLGVLSGLFGHHRSRRGWP